MSQQDDTDARDHLASRMSSFDLRSGQPASSSQNYPTTTHPVQESTLSAPMPLDQARIVTDGPPSSNSEPESMDTGHNVNDTPLHISLHGPELNSGTLTMAATAPQETAPRVVTPTTPQPLQQGAPQQWAPQGHEREGARLQEKQYDALIVAAAVDSDLAEHIVQVIEDNIRLEDGTRPQILNLLDTSKYLHWTHNMFERAQEGLERSTYVFILVTDSFDQDPWAGGVLKKEAVMESILMPEKVSCVIPLTTSSSQPKSLQRLPFGLRSIQPQNIGAICQSFSSDDKKVKSIFQKLKKLFDCRLSSKRQREAAQRQALDDWNQRECLRADQAQHAPLRNARLHVDSDARLDLQQQPNMYAQGGNSPVNVHINFYNVAPNIGAGNLESQQVEVMDSQDGGTEVIVTDHADGTQFAQSQ